MIVEVAVILLLIAANGLFAGAEIAIISVRQTRLEQLVEEKRTGAAALQALRADAEGFLATVQIGITVVGAAAAAFSGATVASRLRPQLARIPHLDALAEDLALALVVIAVSYLSLVFGELVPKSIALRSGERYALLAARPLQAIAWLVRPFVRLLTASSNAVLRPFGDSTSFREARMSREELAHAVGEAARAGTLEERAGEIATRALEFGTLRAADVMLPRNQVVALSRDATPEQIRRAMLEGGQDRVPVFAETLDEIVGYVTAKDLLALMLERELLVLDDILRPAHIVPESASAASVLQELQKRRLWLAVVVDEHGGVAGIVTLEDLLAELVGDLYLEKATPQEALVREPDGWAVVRGDTPVREMNRELDMGLPESEDWSTVAGLCIALAGTIPEPGARFPAGDAILEVLEATPRQVRKVRVRRRAPAGDDG